MKKNNMILTALIVLIGVAISLVMYFPKNIDTALNRIKYPFEAGEVLAAQEIEENLTAVIYTNRQNNTQLQNALIRKMGIFYKVVDMNGSLTIEIEKPKMLESGEPRADVLISWYDKSDKYVVMAVAYDEDVESVTYLDQELKGIDINGYRLFYGYGCGEYTVYELLDKDGNRLEHIKE